MRSFFIVLSTAVCCLSASAHELTLTISAYRGSECNPDTNVILAGSMVQAWVTFRLEPNQPDWTAYLPGNPELKNIEFDIVALNFPSSKLQFADMHPEVAVPYSQLLLRDQWMNNPQSVLENHWSCDQIYNLSIPQNIEGTYAIKARLNSAKFGRLESDFLNITVVKPCNVFDELQTRASVIYGYHFAQNFDTALVRAAELSRMLIMDSLGFNSLAISYVRPEFNYYSGIQGIVAARDPKTPKNLLYPRQIMDQYFRLLEPKPNPLRDYRDLILNDAHKLLDSALKKDPKFRNPFAPELMGHLLLFTEGPQLDNDREIKQPLAGMNRFLEVIWSYLGPSMGRPFSEPAEYDVFTGIEYMGLDKGWPPGLEIQAGYRNLGEEKFNYSKSLVEKMHFKLIPWPEHVRNDRMLKSGVPLEKLNRQDANREFMFVFDIPEDMGGKEINLEAIYHHEKYGSFDSRDAERFPENDQTFFVKKVETPAEKQSRADLEIRLLLKDEKYSEVINYVDNCIKQGFASTTIVNHGRNAAEKLKDIPTQLRLLDYEYKNFGLVREWGGLSCGTPPIPIQEPVPLDPIRNKIAYDRQKDKILRGESTNRRLFDIRAEPQFEIFIEGARGSSCDSSYNSTIAGRRHQLYFDLLCPDPDSTFTRTNDTTTPFGFTYEVCATNSLSDTFVNNLELGRILSLPDSIPSSSDEETWTNKKGRVFANNIQKFVYFTPPASLANQYIRFRCHYRSEKGWSIHTGDVSIKVLLPCSVPDSVELFVETLKFWNEMDQFETTISLTDSAITAGNYDPEILFYGREAAHDAKRFEDALAIIDLAWKKNGFVNPIPRNTKPFGDEEVKNYRIYKYQILRHWKANGDGPQDLMPPKQKDWMSAPDPDPGEDSNIIAFSDYHSNIGKSK